MADVRQDLKADWGNEGTTGGYSAFTWKINCWEFQSLSLISDTMCSYETSVDVGLTVSLQLHFPL